MAEKKKNLYSIAHTETLKKELASVVEYLEDFDLQAMTDKIEWRSLGSGGTGPFISSSKERIIETVISEVERSAGIITMLFESEGLTEELKIQIDITTNKLNELKDFYFDQSHKDIKTRVVNLTAGEDRNGRPKNYRLIAATEEDQIRARGKITKNIYKIIPMIDVIKTYKTSTVRGGVQATPAMIRFEERKKQQRDKGLDENDDE